jgi:NADH dehydrogenase
MATLAGWLPGAPITRDQWIMLQSDNVVSEGAEGLSAFDINPIPLGAVAPNWLILFRRHGRFSAEAKS